MEKLSEATLQAQNLAFAYRRGHPVLEDVSLEIGPGSLTAILGPNGCGKSTLLSLLTAARKPSAGTVLLNGIPMEEVNRKERAKTLAFVSQHSHSQRLTVFDAILMGRQPFMDSSPTTEDRAKVASVIAELGLKSYATAYMDELSGGEYQTVVLARAFAQQTPLLLLDEPTNNLDPANQQEVMNLVRKRVNDQGIGAAAVMHDLNLALRFCDRFLFLKDGKVDASGGETIVTAEEIQRVYGVKVDLLDHRGHRIAVPIMDTLETKEENRG